MNYFSWIAQERTLTDAALTVRAQAILPADVEQILHDQFFPRRNVASVLLSEVGNVDFRPTGERREWNARGRQINQRTPDTKELEFIPIETYLQIGEREIQRYMEQTLGNEAVFRDIIRASLPDRIDDLAQANIRRMEIDAFRAWANGSIVVKHPQEGSTQTVSYGFDSGRYQTAGTAWDDAAVNSYEEFLAWIEDGIDEVGAIAGVVLTRAIYRTLQADAPKGLDDIPLTRRQFVDRVQQDTGTDFQFYVLEHELDVYTDGGLETVRERVWPAEKMALVPAGIAVGSMCYAPVARAHDIARGVTGAGARIDRRGQTVFIEIAGNGRQATWECQVNAFPVPREERMWVIDTGVAD